MTVLRIALATVVAATLIACGKNSSTPASDRYLPPAGFVGSADQGAPLFTQHCARCHGEQAVGTNVGPPLVHKYYEPNHHADLAFYRAVKKGVQAHHWQFGDMPPVEGVAPEQAAHIVAYIRGLQRAAGIF